MLLLGVLLVTVGFFGAHSVASSWVGRRSARLPGGSPALAAAQYLFGYYAGSSIGGALGGIAYETAGWPAVAGYVAALLLGALVLARGVRPLGPDLGLGPDEEHEHLAEQVVGDGVGVDPRLDGEPVAQREQDHGQLVGRQRQS